MEIFRNAKTVRLKSHHNKYLVADDDQESVTQERNGSNRNARWTVEIVGSGTSIRLKSCHGKYLTASNQPFLLGMTGRKVLQTLPNRLNSSLEWEPLKERNHVRLQTKYGHFLRANGRLPPWRNSVTHDSPHRSSHQDWVLWNVEVLERLSQPDLQRSESTHLIGAKQDVLLSLGPSLGERGPRTRSHSIASDVMSSRQEDESSDSDRGHSPPKADGRRIHYRVVRSSSDVDDPTEAKTFTFKGHNVRELSQKLKEVTELKDIFICTRSPLNGKLYPLRLQLPPNNQEMNIFVVPSSSELGEEFASERH